MAPVTVAVFLGPASSSGRLDLTVYNHLTRFTLLLQHHLFDAVCTSQITPACVKMWCGNSKRFKTAHPTPPGPKIELSVKTLILGLPLILIIVKILVGSDSL
jgi:hypothetical protein